MITVSIKSTHISAYDNGQCSDILKLILRFDWLNSGCISYTS